jgi:hypothetical protein
MDQLSKILSLAVGLIVVVAAFAVFTGRINLGNGFPKLLSNNTVKTTPTPTISQPKFNQLFENTDKQLSQATKTNEYNSSEMSKSSATSIPATGNPTIMLTLAIGTFAMGNYLRRLK